MVCWWRRQQGGRHLLLPATLISKALTFPPSWRNTWNLATYWPFCCCHGNWPEVGDNNGEMHKAPFEEKIKLKYNQHCRDLKTLLCSLLISCRSSTQPGGMSLGWNFRGKLGSSHFASKVHKTLFQQLDGNFQRKVFLMENWGGLIWENISFFSFCSFKM